MSSRKKRKIYGGISIFFAVSVVSLAAMFAPFAKAEAAYSWKDITIPGGNVKESRISSDGSKLIVLQEGPLLMIGSFWFLLMAAQTGAVAQRQKGQLTY